MEENINKEMIEKITSSKYFETLVDEQIRARMGELYRSNKWIVRALIVVIAIIAFFLGKDFYDINQQLDKYQARYNEYQTKFDRFQREADTLIKLRSSFEAQLDILDIQNKNEGEISDKRENINLEYQEFLGQKLQDLQKSYSEIKELFETNKSLNTSMAKSIKESDATREKLNDIYENSIRPELAKLVQTTRKIEITSSIRYLFAERSDRTSSGNEYRPATLKLPFSNDVLKVVFHDVLTDDNPKEVLIDLYLNNDKKPIDQTIFTESGGSYDQNIINFTSSEKNIYEIRAVFIYLPPNPPLYRIPDFVVLKISLTDKGENK